MLLVLVFKFSVQRDRRWLLRPQSRASALPLLGQASASAGMLLEQCAIGLKREWMRPSCASMLPPAAAQQRQQAAAATKKW